MKNARLTGRMHGPTYGGMMRATMILGLAALGGCVNVAAPDKPIEINLNIKITQEVIYRLDREAKALIKDNPNIF